jgi:hypothetical protein
MGAIAKLRAAASSIVLEHLEGRWLLTNHDWAPQPISMQLDQVANTVNMPTGQGLTIAHLDTGVDFDHGTMTMTWTTTTSRGGQ